MKKILWLALVAVVVGWGLGRWLNRSETQPVIWLPTSLQPRQAVVPSPTPFPRYQPVKILFGGDLMFDRTIRQRMVQFGVHHPLSQLQPLFQEYDMVIANLEGPVTPWPSKSVGSAVGSSANFIFTFDPAIVPMLKSSKMTIVNLGNNHILNFGQPGLESTIKYLTDGDIQFFGNTGSSPAAPPRTLFTEWGGRSVALVNLNQFVPQGWEAALADVKVATMAAEIVVVMPHWGEEYTPEPNRVIQQQAHDLIDAGADVVIGAHPHVVQPWEEYQGRRIYYSLGNLVFDQYFSQETKTGLLVGLEITPDNEWQFTEYYVELFPNGQTKLKEPGLEVPQLETRL
jgi:hypothetical protein